MASRDRADPSARAATQRGGRVVGLDVARALAVIGMIAVNVGPWDLDSPLGVAYAAPTGRASILFVLLAGISFALLTRPGRLDDASRRWGTIAWRGGLLLVLGLGLQLLDHDVNVILPTYAALFLLGGLLVRAPDRLLLAIAAATVVVGPVLWLLLNPGGDRLAPDRGTSPARLVELLLVSGGYPVVTWAAPFVLGLWLARRDLSDPRTARRLVVVGGSATVAAAGVAAVATRLWHDPDGSRATLLVTDTAHGQMPLWLVGATASACLVLGLALLVARRIEGSLRPLVATGRLALTVYVAHLLVLAAIRPRPDDLPDGVTITALLIAGSVLFAVVWLRFFAHGPLEHVLRPQWLAPRRTAS